jgi:hypothetical protein
MPDVFALPREYEEALKHKIKRVARMRAAVKTSFLDPSCKHEVQSVIQAFFKEWLKSTGNIRQVYDLARLEREHARGAGGSRKSGREHGDGARRRSSKERASAGAPL